MTGVWLTGRRQQRLHADRADRAGGAVGEERDPDRGVRARAGVRRAHAGAGGDRGQPAAAAPDPDDLAGLHHGRAAAGALHRRRRRDAPGDGRRGVRRHDRRDRLRPVPDAGVLRAAAPRSPATGRSSCTARCRTSKPSRGSAGRAGRGGGAPVPAARRSRDDRAASRKFDHEARLRPSLRAALRRCSPRWCWPAAPPRRPSSPRLPPPAAVQGAGDGALDRRARAGRGAAARRLVEGLRRPGLDDLVERAGARQHQHPGGRGAAGRRRARWLRSADADRAAAARRWARAARGSAGAGPQPAPRPSTLVTAGVDCLVRGRPVRPAVARQRCRRARCRRRARRCCRARACWCRPRSRRPTSRCARSTPSARWCATPSTAYRDTLRLTERRYRAGDVAELDVARVRDRGGRRPKSEALALDRRRAELEHALAVLVGEAASDFALAARRLVAPRLPADPGRRAEHACWRAGPTSSAAQSSVLAAQARVGVAQAAWFPSIVADRRRAAMRRRSWATCSSGRRAPGASARCCRCRCSTAAGARPACRARRPQLDGALASYREQVLVAFKDVEDQLSALRLLARAVEAQARAVASAQPRHRAVGLALPQRPGQPARPARCAPQRTAQPPPGAAGAVGAVPGDGRADPRAGRRLGVAADRDAAAELQVRRRDRVQYAGRARGGASRAESSANRRSACAPMHQRTRIARPAAWRRT